MPAKRAALEALGALQTKRASIVEAVTLGRSEVDIIALTAARVAERGVIEQVAVLDAEIAKAQLAVEKARESDPEHILAPSPKNTATFWRRLLQPTRGGFSVELLVCQSPLSCWGGLCHDRR
jgi:hypothetical protein